MATIFPSPARAAPAAGKPVKMNGPALQALGKFFGGRFSLGLRSRTRSRPGCHRLGFQPAKFSSAPRRLRGESMPGFGRDPFVFSSHSHVSARQTILPGRQSPVFDRQILPIGGHPVGFNRYPLGDRRLPSVARTPVERSRRAAGHPRTDAAGKFFPVKGNSCRV